jgi:hypothetical protein
MLLIGGGIAAAVGLLVVLMAVTAGNVSSDPAAQAGGAALGAFGGLMLALIVMLGLATYFLPTFVAMFRGHRQVLAIFMLNFLGGWLLLGWIGAIVWACTEDRSH